MENAVGFLRRNLLVPVPEAGSLEEPSRMLRDGCDRLNAQSASRDGRPTAQAFQEDLAGMLELPGVPFDAVRWGKAKSDKRGYVRVDGNLYCAGSPGMTASLRRACAQGRWRSSPTGRGTSPRSAGASAKARA